jgi:predicted phage terminase large subunit-like protein
MSLRHSSRARRSGPADPRRAALARLAEGFLELRTRESTHADPDFLRSREAAERSLRDYVRASWPIIEPDTPLVGGWYLDCIAEHLEAVTAGQITRLIINVPRRMGKSTLGVVQWPTWEWLRNPGERWVFASYAARLSTEHSVSRRHLIESDWYRSRWGDRYRLVSDQNVKTEYVNDHRGRMFATSVGASALGSGGNRIVVDDPISEADSNSEVRRSASNRFFMRTLYPSLNNKATGAIVIIMQRLHCDDLTGHVEEAMPGQWTKLALSADSHHGPTVVRFPISGAERYREQGEPLCPEIQSKAQVDQMRAILGPYAAAGQLDMEPVPPGGTMFRREWFPVVRTIPYMRTVVRYWDKAATEGGGKYTAGVLLAWGVDGLFYVLDVKRGQWGSLSREKIIEQTAAADPRGTRVGLEREGAGAGKSDAEATARNLAGHDVTIDYPTGSKEVRARPWAAQCGVGGVGREGNVRLVAGPWNEDYIMEHVLFPGGKYSDQVDASSGAFKLASEWRPAGSYSAGGTPPTLDGSIRAVG